MSVPPSDLSGAVSSRSPAAGGYIRACEREGVDCVLDVIAAFNSSAKHLVLSGRRQPLSDLDICCIAEALTAAHAVRVLDLQDNAFGLQGVQSVLDGLVVNPGTVRELRLGRNHLKDPAAIVIGNALANDGAGLKVLDLSDNGFTKIGCAAICQALMSTACDVVEVSFHCNELDGGEAGLVLSQAMRGSGKLKHLHLGYNTLRDAGATHLARVLPSVRTLVTLDLTANRIGAAGGAELARALVAPSCALQRLNLRHNDLDDETLALFIDVVANNNSLTQLSLGFMNPVMETATQFLRQLQTNSTLLLVDICGWPLPAGSGSALLLELLRTNDVLRALVGDQWSAPAAVSLVAEANAGRESRGWHAVYVGSDDRIAVKVASGVALATAAALPSTPAPASRSHSAFSPSRGDGGASPAHSTADPCVVVQAATTRNVDRAAAALTTTTTSVRASSVASKKSVVVVPPSGVPSPQRTRSASEHAAAARSSLTSAGVAQQQRDAAAIRASLPRGVAKEDRELDDLLLELERSPSCDCNELRAYFLLVVARLQTKYEVQRSSHQQQIAALEERVRLMESEQQQAADRRGQSARIVYLRSPRGDTSPSERQPSAALREASRSQLQQQQHHTYAKSGHSSSVASHAAAAAGAAAGAATTAAAAAAARRYSPPGAAAAAAAARRYSPPKQTASLHSARPGTPHREVAAYERSSSEQQSHRSSRSTSATRQPSAQEIPSRPLTFAPQSSQPAAPVNGVAWQQLPSLRAGPSSVAAAAASDARVAASFTTTLSSGPTSAGSTTAAGTRRAAHAGHQTASGNTAPSTHAFAAAPKHTTYPQQILAGAATAGYGGLHQTTGGSGGTRTPSPTSFGGPSTSAVAGGGGVPRQVSVAAMGPSGPGKAFVPPSSSSFGPGEAAVLGSAFQPVRSGSGGEVAGMTTVPLYVPAATTAAGGRASPSETHAPSPVIADAAPTPDLQHSKHQSTNAVLESVPQRQELPSRPRSRGAS